MSEQANNTKKYVIGGAALVVGIGLLAYYFTR